MAVVTFEGIVEDGRVKLDPGVALPENTRVYVVVPDAQPRRQARTRVLSPRLAHREDAKDFELEVSEISDDAGV